MLRATYSQPMGDTSPKNKHKLEDQKHEDHVKKEDGKHENAEKQHHHPHHPEHLPTAEQAPVLPTPEAESGSGAV